MTDRDPWADLLPAGRAALDAYATELASMNRRVNLLARTGEDIEWHLRHCLTLAAHSFPDGASVVDFGTGGGLPAVPLAARFPAVHFIAVDSTEKKVLAVRAMVRRAGLQNIDTWSGRAENWPGTANYVVSRATAPLSVLWNWTQRILVPMSVSGTDWAPGLLCLKGGSLEKEIEAHRHAWPDTRVRTHSLVTNPGSDFDGKYIVQVSPA